MPQAVLNARALKCTIVLDAAEIESLALVEERPRVQPDAGLAVAPADLEDGTPRRRAA